MNKVTKYILLLALAIPYIVVGSLDLLFGILSLMMSGIRVPFNWVSEKIIDKANEINTK